MSPYYCPPSPSPDFFFLGGDLFRIFWLKYIGNIIIEIYLYEFTLTHKWVSVHWVWKKRKSSPFKNQGISVFTQLERHLTQILPEAFICTLPIPVRCHSDAVPRSGGGGGDIHLCPSMTPGLGLSIGKWSHSRSHSSSAPRQSAFGPAHSVPIALCLASSQHRQESLRRPAFGPRCLTCWPPPRHCWEAVASDAVALCVSLSLCVPFSLPLPLSPPPQLGSIFLVWWQSLLYVSSKPGWLCPVHSISLRIFLLPVTLRPWRSPWGLWFCENRRWKDDVCFLFLLPGGDFERAGMKGGTRGSPQEANRKVNISEHDPQTLNARDAHVPGSGVCSVGSNQIVGCEINLGVTTGI